MKRLLLITLPLLFIFVYLSCGYASITIIPQSPKEQIVKLGDGELVFTNIELKNTMGDYTYSWRYDVINRTKIHWGKISIYNIATDDKGNELGFFNYTHIEDLKPDGMVKMGTEFSKSLWINTNLKNEEIEDMGFIIKQATYPANYKFRMIKPDDNSDLRYENKDFVIKFYINSSYNDPKVRYSAWGKIEKMGVQLLNKTNAEMEIDWNRSRYIDIYNVSHTLVPAGIKYTDKNNNKPPAIIPPNAAHSDIILPTDNIYYDDNPGTYNDSWKISPLFPKDYQVVPNSMDSRAGDAHKYNNGGVFKIYLSLMIKGKKENISFDFNINTLK
jgi:hypothetical protein